MMEDRFEKYKENHCWQYEIRLKNFERDLQDSGMTLEQVRNLKVNDFKFSNITSNDMKSKCKSFIERHEWLGNLSQYTTHWFIAEYNDNIAGVILFNMPNAFSKILGEDTKNKERLISRGACISWSPKNLASSFLMWCINWMVENTQYRLFTAYSDPMAKEIGSIYQACNFYYLGQNAGASVRYKNPYTGKIVSDRYFRQKTAYKKFASELGIKWEDNWSHKTGMNWDNIPKDVEKILREYSKTKQSLSDKIIVAPKHKYAFVLGIDKRETKELRKIFLEKNKTYAYPKNRGEW